VRSSTIETQSCGTVVVINDELRETVFIPSGDRYSSPACSAIGLKVIHVHAVKTAYHLVHVVTGYFSAYEASHTCAVSLGQPL